MAIRAFAACFAIGLMLAPVPVTTAEEPAARPRYLLSAGREFTYHNETRSERKGSTSTYVVDWKVWPIGREPDGAWKLVIRCDLKTKRDTPRDQPEREQVDTSVWRCRMFEDGRLVGATAQGTVRDPFRLFPRLPSGPDEIGAAGTPPGRRCMGAPSTTA